MRYTVNIVNGRLVAVFQYQRFDDRCHFFSDPQVLTFLVSLCCAYLLVPRVMSAVYHLDYYPPGKPDMSIGASTRGRNLGMDFGHSGPGQWVSESQYIEFRADCAR